VRKNWLLVNAVMVVLTSATIRADFISTANKGNEAYRKKDYKGALNMYHTAETDIPESPELKYNIAGAMHQEGNFQDAIKQYEGAIKTTDVNLEAQAQYNLGNTYFKMKDFQKAIGSYEESLKLNPKDMDAKFNLELTRKMLKDQIKPQNKQDQNKNQQKQDQQKQDQQKQDQQKQDQQKQDQQNQDQQNQQNKQNKDKQQNQQNAQDQKKMSKEDAARILNALKDDEQQIQKKVRRVPGQGDYVGKDW
jgi:Ca-activated chloride channel family protein